MVLILEMITTLTMNAMKHGRSECEIERLGSYSFNGAKLWVCAMQHPPHRLF